MASAKALAAIALTLIVAIPICLGYGMASNDVPYDSWESDNTYNVSDQLLNSTTPYSTDYLGPQNNSELLQRWTFPGAGVTEYHRVAPDYRSVGSTYSTIPEYTTTNTKVNLSAATSTTYNLAYSGTIVSVGTSGSSSTNTVGTYDRYSIGISTTGPMPLHWTFASDKGQIALSDTSITVVRDGASTWTAIVNGSEVNGIAWWSIRTDYSGSVTVAYRNYTSLSPGSDYTFTTASDLITGLRLNTAGGNSYYTYTEDAQIVSYNGGDVLIGAQAYTNVTSIAVGFPAGSTFVTITTPSPTGNYADPAQGWTIPTYNDRAFWSWWTNGHQNTGVDMMIMFTGDAEIWLSPTQGMTHNSGTYDLRFNSGNLTINGQSLGAYQYVEAVFTEETAVFYGISSWPTMTAGAFRLNSLSFDVDHGIMTTIEIYGVTEDFEDVSFRVDKAETVAGSFPSTKDYTLNMSELFPGKSYALKLNSIGVYGDTISIGSNNYAVANGRITVNGEAVPLKGAVISSRSNGTNYDLLINNYMIGTTADPASIYFGGEWSLTATVDTVKIVHGQKTEWDAGGFAFDKESFVGVIVMVAAFAFIGVGIYGARSGLKAGLLLMVCGGAALIALTTI